MNALIDRRDGRRSLLSTDHKKKPDHAHPTFSDESRRVLIQSAHFTDGKLIALPIPETPTNGNNESPTGR